MQTVAADKNGDGNSVPQLTHPNWCFRVVRSMFDKSLVSSSGVLSFTLGFVMSLGGRKLGGMRPLCSLGLTEVFCARVYIPKEHKVALESKYAGIHLFFFCKQL